MSRALPVLALLLLALPAGAEEIYRWTDAQGEVHYTNDLATIPKTRRKSAVRTSGEELGAVLSGDAPAATAPEAAPPSPPARGGATDLRPDADITGPIERYRADRPHDFLLAVLKARYPTGNAIMEGMGAACTEQYVTAEHRASAEAVLARLEVTVHECGHAFDHRGKQGYFITEAVTFACPGGAHFGANQSFARRELVGDAFAPRRAACAGPARADCDMYSDIYLAAKTAGSEQGYSSVLEETVQYLHSLKTAYAFADQLKPGAKVSARDGLLTFLWYLERYLQLARLKHPSVYAFLAADACWRDATRTVWDRAWNLLALTRTNEQLGLNDAAIEPLVRDPALAREVERFVRAEK